MSDKTLYLEVTKVSLNLLFKYVDTVYHQEWNILLDFVRPAMKAGASPFVINGFAWSVQVGWEL